MKSRYLFYSSLLLFCPASLNSCNNDSEEVVCGSNPCQPCNFSEEVAALYDQLNEMYEDNCVSCLEDFLETWHAKYPPREEIPDSNRLLYEIYRDVYTPWDLGAFTYMDTFNHFYYKPDMNQGVDYYIVRDEVGFNGEYIKEFRPVVDTENVKILYLRPEYELALSCFLDFYLIGFPRPGPRKLNRTELEKREAFLENYLQITTDLLGAMDKFGSNLDNYTLTYYRLANVPLITTIGIFSDSTAGVSIFISRIHWETEIAKGNDGWYPVEIELKWDGSLL